MVGVHVATAPEKSCRAHKSIHYFCPHSTSIVESFTVNANVGFLFLLLKHRVFGVAPPSRQAEDSVPSVELEPRQVELVWSRKKNKVKLYWNRNEITSQVHRSQSESTGRVKYSWKTTSEEILQVVMKPEDGQAPNRENVHLFVNGTRFSRLPSRKELNGSNHTASVEERSPRDEVSRQTIDVNEASLELDECISDPLGPPIPETSSLGFRLSMAGLKPRNTFPGDDIIDELHSSNKYSPVLDAFRERITASIPQAEPLVSRAITNAFCADANSLASCESFSLDSVDFLEPDSVEANFLKDAFDWVKKHPRAESEKKLRFLQKRVDDICLCIRNEQLESDDASRIVIGVAAIIGLAVECGVPCRTILLDGLCGDTFSEDVQEALGRFGSIETIAFASSDDFAICRFSSQSAVTQVLKTVGRNNIVKIGSSSAFVSPLTEGSKISQWVPPAPLEDTSPSPFGTLTSDLSFDDSPVCVTQMVAHSICKESLAQHGRLSQALSLDLHESGI